MFLKMCRTQSLSPATKTRAIAVTATTTKAFHSSVLLGRPLLESQCGFRPDRSTTDMIFSLRQVQEKCREQHMPLYITFIDLTKVFDLVSRSRLLEILKRIGCPPGLFNIIASFHEDTHNIVSFKGTTSEVFPVSSGVKQGCVSTGSYTVWNLLLTTSPVCVQPLR